MASVCTLKNGSTRIQFVDVDRTRRDIYLGKVDAATVKAAKKRVEFLRQAKENQIPLDAAWIAAIPESQAKKLAAVGLIPRQAESCELGDFLDRYVAGRTDVKKSTATVYGHTRRNLIDLFGRTRELRSLTPADADRFRRYLTSEARAPKTKSKKKVRAKAKTRQPKTLSKNTVNRRCGFAKQFLEAAVDEKLISSNPFAGLKRLTIRANRERDYFLSRQDARALADACPDAQWRLIVALSRFGGLRCPSEHLALRWEDVNWERRRIVVHSPKTEHRPGQECRIIPIYPELLEPLREVFEQAQPGKSPFVITRYRDSTTNLRTQLLKIIKRAGLKPWPRLFHNLRATRQTELMKSHPIHVVCEWMGNDALIALEHYLRVEDSDFERAAGLQTPHGTPHEREEMGGIMRKPVPEKKRKTPEKAGFPANSGVRPMVATGLELRADSSGASMFSRTTPHRTPHALFDEFDSLEEADQREFLHRLIERMATQKADVQ